MHLAGIGNKRYPGIIVSGRIGRNRVALAVKTIPKNTICTLLNGAGQDAVHRIVKRAVFLIYIDSQPVGP